MISQTRNIMKVTILAASMAIAVMFGGATTASADSLRDTVDRDRHLFQPRGSSPYSVRDLVPVEQTIEDVSPLASGFRRIELGLRTPTGFDQVYRVPGDDDHYMRIDGGLYAVFPRSVYANTREGEVPLIPANTVFWIGQPDFLLQPMARSQRNEAAEEMRRAFAFDPEAMLVSPSASSFGIDAASLRVDERIMDRPQRAVDRSGPRYQRPLRSPPRSFTPRANVDRVDRGQDGDDALAAESAADRAEFRARMHELLRRAADAESAGNRR